VIRRRIRERRDDVTPILHHCGEDLAGVTGMTAEVLIAVVVNAAHVDVVQGVGIRPR
jgi:hypothetical protein